MASLRVGDPAPDFELHGTQGTFRLSEHRGRRVVLLFYPGDRTPVCTKQFCSYRDSSADVDGLDAVLVGISSQGVQSHAAFTADYGLTVPLLADEDLAVAKAYGAAAPILGTRRAVVVVDEDGRIAHHHVHRLGLDYEDADELRATLDALPARS
jgi:peroxiredoxin Q/BCP